MQADIAVQATNDDAVSAKICAAKLGYWNDPFLQFFCRSAHRTNRKAPEMNRGYYARTQAIKILVTKLIEMTSGKCQIVSLGAGFDTLYWRLKSENLSANNFTEVDFPTVVSCKCHCIKRSKVLLDLLAQNDSEVRWSSSEVHSADYHLVGADLRALSQVKEKLEAAAIDPSVPTVFIAECVLVYMDTVCSSNLLRWIGDTFGTVLFVGYEQANMSDRFGEVMIENLRERGCDLAGVAACKSLASHHDRFMEAGWEFATVSDMMEVYRSLPQKDVQRIEKLEFLDEREVMEQLFKHYCLFVAGKDDRNVGLVNIKL